MTLILSGTNGLSDVDGSAATPAIRGTDANTGIFFPAADTIAFSEGGAEIARFDSSGNFGIGTSSTNIFSRPSPTTLALSGSANAYIQINGATGNNAEIDLGINSVRQASIYTDATAFALVANTNIPMLFSINNSERMRIDTSGNLLVGTTSNSRTAKFRVYKSGDNVMETETDNAGTGFIHIGFINPNGRVGNISTSASSTAYNTSSDYRLKENIAPMTGALAKVALLNPVTYKWKVDGSDGQGFIAHELQEVVEGCVTGEKDAVDAEGNPQYQGIDTSFLVATLTAAIQEQQAIITQLQADVAALKAQP